MAVAIITGSCGLIGSEAVRHFAELGFDTVGIDNHMRRVFFGSGAATEWQQRTLSQSYPVYRHYDLDIRDQDAVKTVFRTYGREIRAVIHCAAQPSHDWAATDPHTDFTINANGTLVLLETTRQTCPDAPFVFTSTNKVYGDRPNTLPLVEQTRRFEIAPDHPYQMGIPESMSIDCSKHSLFGSSKLAADVLVQEYGRYFGMKTVCFRAGCMTGPAHSGAPLHGFLSYLMKCAITGTRYTIIGYNGKQVRDNIHSRDVIAAFWQFCQTPRAGEVYNLGGGRHCNCSVLEAIEVCEEITGRALVVDFEHKNREGDHIWWISDNGKFEEHYSGWRPTYKLHDILAEIHAMNAERWLDEARGGSTVPRS